MTDRCVRETKQERFERLSHDLLAWGTAVCSGPDEFFAVIARVSEFMILAAPKKRRKTMEGVVDELWRRVKR